MEKRANRLSAFYFEKIGSNSIHLTVEFWPKREKKHITRLDRIRICVRCMARQWQNERKMKPICVHRCGWKAIVKSKVMWLLLSTSLKIVIGSHLTSMYALHLSFQLGFSIERYCRLVFYEPCLWTRKIISIEYINWILNQ